MIIDEVNRVHIALTIPALMLGALVLLHFLPLAVRILRKGEDARGRAEDNLIVGVAIGFLGFELNTLFWAVHFLAVERGWQSLIDLTYLTGPSANVVTRLIPYALAAYFHLRAVSQFIRGHARRPNAYVMGASVLAALSYLALKLTAPI